MSAEEGSSPAGNTECQFYMMTPLLESKAMKKLTGLNVHLKLENLQPPGSFKCRGISNLCKKAVERGCTGIVCASGGNGGLAAAYCAQQMGIPAWIILPQSTPSFTADLLRDNYGANVEIHGRFWDESNQRALALCKERGYEYIHPFNNPYVWQGHTSLMKETADQLGCKPDLVVVSVGGGGLLVGIAMGMWEIGWNDVPILCMETKGADCFNCSVTAGQSVTLPGITSIAQCLGAATPCERSLECFKEHPMISEVVEDREAIRACLRFADDHRMLVEPACGAALSAIYSNLIPKLQSEGKLGNIQSIVMVVCGGANVSLGLLQKWKSDFNL